MLMNPEIAVCSVLVFEHALLVPTPYGDVDGLDVASRQEGRGALAVSPPRSHEAAQHTRKSQTLLPDEMGTAIIHSFSPYRVVWSILL